MMRPGGTRSRPSAPLPAQRHPRDQKRTGPWRSRKKAAAFQQRQPCTPRRARSRRRGAGGVHPGRGRARTPLGETTAALRTSPPDQLSDPVTGRAPPAGTPPRPPPGFARLPGLAGEGGSAPPRPPAPGPPDVGGGGAPAAAPGAGGRGRRGREARSGGGGGPVAALHGVPVHTGERAVRAAGVLRPLHEPRGVLHDGRRLLDLGRQRAGQLLERRLLLHPAARRLPLRHVPRPLQNHLPVQQRVPGGPGGARRVDGVHRPGVAR